MICDLEGLGEATDRLAAVQSLRLCLLLRVMLDCQTGESAGSVWWYGVAACRFVTSWLAVDFAVLRDREGTDFVLGLGLKVEHLE